MKWMKSLSVLLLFAVFFSMTACDTMDGLEDNTSDAKLTSNIEGVTAKAKPGTEGVAGNNLSFPVIWSDGAEKALRGTAGMEPVLNGYSFDADGGPWYVQDDPDNVWQAESFNAVSNGAGTVAVDAIDWGDNLEAKSWPFGSQVRVETVLHKNLSSPMTAYTMKAEDPTVSGPNEVWGTNGTTYLSDEATIYSGTARLVIQKLNYERDDPNLALTWDPTTSMWTGTVGGPLFTGGVWDSVDGPGGYSAEINVQGKVIYGYNWVTRRTALGAGDYRITFVLDPTSSVTYNTDFTGTTLIVPREEEEVTITEEPDLGGGTAHVVPEHNLTYIDVRLTLKNGGDKPGNGGGGNGGGGGGGGPGNGGGGGGPGGGQGPNH